jgi:hypothetical protein
LSEISTALNSKTQPSTYVRTQKRCSATVPDGRFLDDHCDGDLDWEHRMKMLNPNWRPTDSSLWDAYHE